MFVENEIDFLLQQLDGAQDRLTIRGLQKALDVVLDRRYQIRYQIASRR